MTNFVLIFTLALLHLYSFDWTLDLSSGGREKMRFSLDSKLTKTSQGANLEGEYKTNPFVPDVD